MGFGREARRVRDEALPHGQRLQALAQCLEWAQPVGFNPSRHYLETKVGMPWERNEFLIPALELLEQERNRHLDLDHRCSLLRKRQKEHGLRSPRPDEVTPRFPVRWHGDERVAAAHALRWWLQRHPLEDFVDHPEAKLAVDVARALALAPSLNSFDMSALQGSLEWARRKTRTERMTDRKRAFDVLRLLGHVHIVVNGAPVVGVPWNFDAPSSAPERQRSAVEAMLRDAVGLWRSTPYDGTRELADAATDLLVLGFDSDNLALLAGVEPLASQFDVADLVSDVLMEFGITQLLDGSHERAGLEVRLRRFTEGRLSLRELSSWAHRSIGHDGDVDCQPFVDLDDIYDDWESSGQDLEFLARAARRAANDFLAGRSPRQLDRLEPPTTAVANGNPAPQQSRRWRRRLGWRRSPRMED